MSDRLLRITVVVAMLAATSAMAQTEAPAAATAGTVSESTRVAESDLSPTQKAEVDAFVAFCTAKIIDKGSEAKDIDACRSVFMTTGRGSESYKRYFASSVAANFAPAALKADRSTIVQVNAAIVIGSLDQPEIVPVLTRMLVHPNPAVRYHGFKGFVKVRKAAAAAGGSGIEAMLAPIVAAAKTEEVAAVVGVCFEALNFSDETVDVVTARAANRAAIALLTRHVQAVRDGDAPMAGAFGRGVDCVAKTADRLPAGDRGPSLQAMADVMANAGVTYYEISNIEAAGSGRKLTAPPGQYLMLLTDAERALIITSGLRIDASVTRALKLRPAKEDVLRVKIAINDLVGAPDMAGSLAKAGVKAPAPLAPTAKVAAK